jgi:hypothetical protein
VISSSVIRHISRVLAHSATRFAAHFAEGFAYEDGGQMLSTKNFAAFPADFFGWRGSRSVCRQAGIS